MPIKNVEVEQKRPLDATPERALSMYEAGVKQSEIAKLWGISAGRVSHLIAKAKKRAAQIRFIHKPGVKSRVNTYWCWVGKHNFTGFVPPDKCPICKSKKWRAG